MGEAGSGYVGPHLGARLRRLLRMDAVLTAFRLQLQNPLTAYRLKLFATKSVLRKLLRKMRLPTELLRLPTGTDGFESQSPAMP